MEKYPISPEDCLILVAINQTASLREAARQLNCDPAGLMRKVQRIASDDGLLKKLGGRWSLTSKGHALVGWTNESILAQKKLLGSTSILRISSTMWFAEQILIPHISDLKKTLSDVQQFSFSADVGDFEKKLLQADCDFVIVCHAPENPLIAHRALLTEEWVCAVSPKLLLTNKKLKTTEALPHLPFIRHSQLNPDILLQNAVDDLKNSYLTFDNLIGVRAALRQGLGWSFVPKALVTEDLKTQRLQSIPLAMTMDRKVCLWWLRNNNSAKKKAASLSQWLFQIIARS